MSFNWSVLSIPVICRDHITARLPCRDPTRSACREYAIAEKGSDTMQKVRQGSHIFDENDALGGTVSEELA